MEVVKQNENGKDKFLWSLKFFVMYLGFITFFSSLAGFLFKLMAVSPITISEAIGTTFVMSAFLPITFLPLMAAAVINLTALKLFVIVYSVFVASAFFSWQIHKKENPWL